MFCPKCGGINFEQLFGGCAARQCIYCGQSIYCRDVFTGKMEKDSIPINNPIKAANLRRAYNKFPGNKEKGKKNIKENQAFRDGVDETHRRINENKKKKGKK